MRLVLDQPHDRLHSWIGYRLRCFADFRALLRLYFRFVFGAPGRRVCIRRRLLEVGTPNSGVPRYSQPQETVCCRAFMGLLALFNVGRHVGNKLDKGSALAASFRDGSHTAHYGHILVLGD